MKVGSRISHLDFKARGQRPRRRRVRWMLLAGFACVSGGVVLTLMDGAGAPAAPPQATATSETDSKEVGNTAYRMRLTLPGQESGAPAPMSARTASIVPAVIEQLVPEHIVSSTRAPVSSPGQETSKQRQVALATLAAIPGFITTRPGIPALADSPAEATTGAPADRQWKSYTVRSGDNLAALFQRAGLSARDVHNIVNADEKAAALVRIYPGDTLEIAHDAGGALQAVRYQLSEAETLEVARGDSGFASSVVEHAPEVQLASAGATIKSSLFVAGAGAGLDDRLIMELAGIFGWDVDFALDIRQGDSFTVIYEELYRDGERLRSGDIVAAEFVNRGDVFRAVRYTNPEGHTGYFTPDGRSMRKEFLRTPIDFARVSSGFNPQRLHPILGVRRPHMGTDYAAATGTPIKAAGDGKIIHRGRKGGYGRTVIIQHGTRYTTLYAHMSGYKSGHSVGSRVRQGQVIGYVGSSGMSTGPHLHYEFRVDGVHRNSRTVELPEAEPIPDRFLADFRASTQTRLAQLTSLSPTRLAQVEGDE